MSRKLRVEQKKILQLKADVQEELDKFKLQKERIFSPIIWNVLSHLNIQIQDLKDDRYEEALKLIEDNYFDEDLLCRNVNIKEDKESMDSFLDRTLFNFKYRQSIIAIDLETLKIIGVLVFKTIAKSDCGSVFWRVQMIKGESFKKIIRFIGQVTRKFNIYEHFDIDTYLEYSLICIDQEYRHKEIGFEMMLCGLKVARAQHCPVVAGLFETFKIQDLAEELKMKILYKINYTDWKDEDGEMIFPEPGAGNYYCALMGGVVPPDKPPLPPPKTVEEIAEEKRQELKRKLKEAGEAKPKKRRF